MLNTYIKNQGITKTVLHNNNNNLVNQINWDADYDGNIANITFDTNTNGKRNHFNVSLDNEDLENILNIESINMPLHQRLKNDFQDTQYIPEYQYIELPMPNFETKKIKTANQLLSNHVSSPLSNEELIVPLNINKKPVGKYTLTPRKRHKKLKTHITHRFYKRAKTSSKKTKSMPKSSRKNSMSSF
jgi:hypothetical protein